MKRSIRILTPATAVIAAAAIAGCGGASPAAGSASTKQGFKSIVADAYKNAACMRQHGVTNFPDPVVNDQNGQQSISVHIVPSHNAPAFANAQKLCAHFMPAASNGGPGGETAGQQQAHLQGLLSFVRCLRTHGFPNFPDPASDGHLNLSAVTAAGIDLHQPALLQAGDACVSSSHGYVNKAAVYQAVNGSDQPGSSSASAAGG